MRFFPWQRRERSASTRSVTGQPGGRKRRSGPGTKGLTLERLESRVVPGFVAPLSYDAGTNPVAVAVGDFNGDGIPDLALA